MDAVLVYKVDRLAFISVTQQTNSATSMGRLMLNNPLSFGRFEREIISERTREKIAAVRRKGFCSPWRVVVHPDRSLRQSSRPRFP